MEKVKAMSPRSIIYFVLAFLCALNAIFNMASCGEMWAYWEISERGYEYEVHYGLWKIVETVGKETTEYTFDEYCDAYNIKDCTVDQSISTGRGATILGTMFFIPAACVYAYLAAKDKANFALEVFLAVWCFILMCCSFGAAGEMSTEFEGVTEPCANGCRLSECAGSFALFVLIGSIFGMFYDVKKMGVPIPKSGGEATQMSQVGTGEVV